MSSPRIDWSQLWYPGPARRFSAEEMARAGSDEPSTTLKLVVLVQVVSVVVVLLLLVPGAEALRLVALIAGMSAVGWGVARWLWWRPWRGPLNLAVLVLLLVMGAGALGLRWLVPEREQRLLAGLVLVVGLTSITMAVWFLVVWRSHAISARLAEMAEREQAVEMARRLAAAQIEPHFLFNTLASLQHWVDTRDERASPLLAALTGYLRATLPMFKRPTQPLADELVASERYLQVMQARLGARLAFAIDVPPALAAQPLPSGVLLTLVENAVQHGIEPSLAGGRVDVRARRDGGSLLVEVVDTGPGPAPGAADGIGLTNVRQRLAMLAGPSASFALERAAGGGAVARLILPAADRGATP